MLFLDWQRTVPKIQVRFGTPCIYSINSRFVHHLIPQLYIKKIHRIYFWNSPPRESKRIIKKIVQNRDFLTVWILDFLLTLDQINTGILIDQKLILYYGQKRIPWTCVHDLLFVESRLICNPLSNQMSNLPFQQKKVSKEYLPNTQTLLQHSMASIIDFWPRHLPYTL